MSETRRTRLFGADGPKGDGLEIGALDAPMLRRPGHDVLYVDYAATEVIRANQFDPSVDLDALVEVDIVWGGAPLREAVGREVDFIAASHVIEHVPDLIGWLHELRAVLKPGGALGLVVPDKRFTFDALRRETTLAECVEAWLLAYRRPSLRQVFDAASLGVAVEAGQVWAGAFDPKGRRAEVLSRLSPALELVQALQKAPQYRDAHCWVFTPASFLALAEELAALGLFPFRIDGFEPTEAGGAEFYVRLAAAGSGDPDIAASIRRAQRALLGAAEPATALQDEVARLRSEVDALRASTSWKLTAPLRGLKRLLARG